MVQINCPMCRSLLVFEDGMAGSVVPCPDCHAKIHVPAPWDAADESDTVLVAPQDEDVLAELERMQTQKPGWLGTSAVLVISMILFIGAQWKQQIWDSIFILVPVLFFHELGHYLAMRLFGYRNLRMFFIPFFGAAVTGKHYNIAGWKKPWWRWRGRCRASWLDRSWE
jgi:hypothetical protein